MTPTRLDALRAHILAPGRPHLTPLAISELFDHIDELTLNLARVTLERDEARTAANALAVFDRQAGCTDDELGAVFQAYSPATFSGVPAWLTPQRPLAQTEGQR